MDVAAARGAVGRPLRFADLTLDRRTRVVMRGVRRIELTPIEFALLELLLENAETVLISFRHTLSELIALDTDFTPPADVFHAAG